MQLIKDFITILEEIFQDAFKNAQTIEGFSYNNKSAVKDLRCKSFTCYPYYAVNSKNFYSFINLLSDSYKIFNNLQSSNINTESYYTILIIR